MLGLLSGLGMLEVCGVTTVSNVLGILGILEELIILGALRIHRVPGVFRLLGELGAVWVIGIPLIRGVLGALRIFGILGVLGVLGSKPKRRGECFWIDSMQFQWNPPEGKCKPIFHDFHILGQSTWPLGDTSSPSPATTSHPTPHQAPSHTPQIPPLTTHPPLHCVGGSWKAAGHKCVLRNLVTTKPSTTFYDDRPLILDVRSNCHGTFHKQSCPKVTSRSACTACIPYSNSAATSAQPTSCARMWHKHWCCKTNVHVLLPQRLRFGFHFFLFLSDGVAMLDLINIQPSVPQTDFRCHRYRSRRFVVILISPIIPVSPTHAH